MSEVKGILTESQLVKHYQVMQYLAKHPNEAFSLAQLDYLLPRGAALQRFPDAWVLAMRDGAGNSRSVELVDKDGGEGQLSASALSDVAADRAAEYLAQRAQRVMLVCRRPEVQTLEALAVILQSPSTQLDAEACVAIHTDQILLSTALLRDAQRAGLAYYFPDNYSKDELRIHTLGAAGGADGASKRSGDLSHDGSEPIAERCVYPALPPGLHLHHELFTLRGLRTRDEHCIPVHLQVGEVLFLVIDNITAVEKRLGRQHHGSLLRVEHDVRVSGVSVIPGTDEAPVVIDVKQRAVHAVPRTTSATTDDPSPASSPTATAAAATVKATKVVMRVTAVRAVASMKLVLSFPNYLDEAGAALAPCVVTMQVLDEPMGMPGVLVGRDRRPPSFAPAERILLKDPLVNPAPTTAPSTFANVAESGAPRSHEPATSATAGGASNVNDASQLALLPLPWWESSSPLVLGVRDATYPSEAHVRAAVERVFSANALSAVARQQVTRLSLLQTRNATCRRKRTRSRLNMNLTNRHLTHFGLDTSMPCSPDGRS